MLLRVRPTPTLFPISILCTLGVWGGDSHWVNSLCGPRADLSLVNFVYDQNNHMELLLSARLLVMPDLDIIEDQD